MVIFVGLANKELSILRVATRADEHGHGVPTEKLRSRFGRTQVAIKAASTLADATVFVDNSRDKSKAFTVCRVQIKDEALFDVRALDTNVPSLILQWLEIVSPS